MSEVIMRLDDVRSRMILTYSGIDDCLLVEMQRLIDGCWETMMTTQVDELRVVTA